MSAATTSCHFLPQPSISVESMYQNVLQQAVRISDPYKSAISLATTDADGRSFGTRQSEHSEVKTL